MRLILAMCGVVVFAEQPECQARQVIGTERVFET